MEGYVNTDTLEIRVVIKIMGMTVGTFVGNLKEGLVVKVNLIAAKGELKLYVKNGNELWLKYDIEIKFDGGFHGDKKIGSW